MTLQVGLDNGYFTRQIAIVKVDRSVTATAVVAGIYRSATATGIRIGLIMGFIMDIITGIIIGIITTGTLFGDYVPVRAGGGKLDGTGATVLTGVHAVLLSALDSLQQRR